MSKKNRKGRRGAPRAAIAGNLASTLAAGGKPIPTTVDLLAWFLRMNLRKYDHGAAGLLPPAFIIASWICEFGRLDREKVWRGLMSSEPAFASQFAGPDGSQKLFEGAAAAPVA